MLNSAVNYGFQDYMTESPGNEPNALLFDRIRQMVSARGADIRPALNGNAMRLEFADGQRILVTLDAQTHNVWLAARSGGIEFIHRDGIWSAHDNSELFGKLRELIEQTIGANPINARPASVQKPQPVPPEPVVYYEVKQSHRLRTALIVLLAGLIGFWAALRLNHPQGASDSQTGPDTVSLSQLDPGHHCEGNLPANGNVTVFPGSGLRADNPNDPEVALKNDHTHPVLLILSAPQTAIPALSVLIKAGQSVSLHIPPGRYDMMFNVGTAWCNPRSGFSDGRFLKFDKPLDIQPDKPMQLSMQSSGTGMDDFQLFVKATETAAPPPTFSGDGSMEVARQANGHFYLPGSIENVPVSFVVDTGASVTSISSDLARQAGIRNCKEMQFQTANGSATGCIALVSHMTLGNFTLENITVAVMPNLETNLLGANVLRNFQVSQNGSSMLIARR